ncbi:M10 family metallopeptidase C-terminal domain-containing protein [Nitrosomonas sp.]|jgi:Ca2+-binding RTX toxin-like protein|uniref:calcium-binding protein n=1 Tax=Nitrosomonas sp. TaxID=42353 RepID=UPI000A7F983C|nr:M10 family metallopeptidase C-terminal domain-containing protein [Nitrosomonas sp.]MBY0483101.1 M10 family metallopeptidase C-terminal domain-containing protein [Nitrosomonas sp.]
MAIINGTASSDDGSTGTGFPLLGTVGNDDLNANWSAGNDTMYGGAGNDIYRINSITDQIFEAFANGTDTVITRNASTTLKTNFENLTLDNTAGFLTALNGTGNSAANVITGNSNANILTGLGGNDTISAGGGNDTIIGGSGKDTMTDGGGNDTYDFNATSESAVGANRDICTDFTHLVDKIDLSTIDANVVTAGNQAFTFIGNVAFTGTAGEVRYFTSGSDIIIQVELDNDGNLTADMEIQLTGAATTGINASDFIL